MRERSVWFLNHATFSTQAQGVFYIMFRHNQSPIISPPKVNEVELYHQAMSLIQGKPQDLNKGIECLMLSANKGFYKAESKLGLYYMIGKGVEKDLKKGIELLTLAANKNDSEAQFCLGICYLKSKGVGEDLKKGLQYIIQAADKGYCTEAQGFLADCYLNGQEGVKKDLREALKYYRLYNQKKHDASVAELCNKLENQLKQDEIHQHLINSFKENNLIKPSANIAIQAGVEFIQNEKVFVNTKLPNIINRAFYTFFELITGKKKESEIFLTFLNKNAIVNFLRFIMELTNTLLSSLQRHQKQNGLNYYGNIDTLAEWIVQVLIENLIYLPYKQFKIDAINDIINELNKRLPSLPPAGITYKDLEEITKNILAAEMKHSQNQLAGMNSTDSANLAPTNRIKTEAIKNESFPPRDDLPQVTPQVNIKEEKEENYSSSVPAFFNPPPPQKTVTNIKPDPTNKRKRAVSTADTAESQSSKRPKNN